MADIREFTELLLGIQQSIKQVHDKIDVTTTKIERAEAKLSDVEVENKHLKDSILLLERKIASSNCSPSLTQAISQELLEPTSLVSPYTTNRNPYGTTNMSKVTILKRGREEISEEGENEKAAKKHMFDNECSTTLMPHSTNAASSAVGASENALVENLLKNNFGEIYPNISQSYGIGWEDLKSVYVNLLDLNGSFCCYKCHMKHNRPTELGGPCDQYRRLQTKDAIACKECLLIGCVNCPGPRAKLIASICASLGPVREIVKRNLDKALMQEKSKMPSFPDKICLWQPMGEHIEAMHQFFDTLLQNATYNKLFWDAVDKTGIFTIAFLSKSKSDIWNSLNTTMMNRQSSISL